ncbi:MAG: hypothetical protein K0U93_22885 [Gammaproteobacteria bacterium]|nr:hypothetical protein [Gammaproteobacteria bacterium]
MVAAAVDTLVAPSDDRPTVLEGCTYKRKISTSDGVDVNVYITICEQDGKPFEMFLNCSDAKFAEFTAVAMILASRLLRAGVDPAIIAEDLESIHSPFTGHFSKHTSGFCPSLAASIGQVIRKHAGG